MSQRPIISTDPSRGELYLGGMLLTSHHGDVDIYPVWDESRSVRLQRADIDEIIKFLQQAKKSAS